MTDSPKRRKRVDHTRRLTPLPAWLTPLPTFCLAHSTLRVGQNEQASQSLVHGRKVGIMDRNKLNIGLASVLTTLAEVPSAPEGTMYAAMMPRYSLDEFHSIMALLRNADMVTVEYNLATITSKGKELAAEITAATRR